MGLGDWKEFIAVHTSYWYWKIDKRLGDIISGRLREFSMHATYVQMSVYVLYVYHQ